MVGIPSIVVKAANPLRIRSVNGVFALTFTIDTLRLESSLTPSELWDYHSRSQRITALYRELDQIRRDRIW